MVLIELSLVFLGLTVDKAFIYALFVLMAVSTLYRYKRTYSFPTKMLILSLYSVIVPDNYVPEFFILLYFITVILCKNKIHIQRKNTIYIGMFCVWCVISTAINGVPIINILFALITLLPFFLLLIFVGNKKNQSTIFALVKQIDQVLYIEFASLPINLINSLLLGSGLGDDWSTGTFLGAGEQSQLFIVATLLAMFYWFLYGIDRKKQTKYKLLMSLIMAVSTNCWTLTLLFFAGIGVYILTTINLRKAILIILAIMIVPFAVRLLPSKITLVVNALLTDSDYFDYRFHKAVVYKETFITIPSQDLLFAVFGNGIGYYDSRAALICSGEYVSFYNKLFSPSISKYTSEYIYDFLHYSYLYGGDYESVLARPYSSVLALLGESGYVGFLLFILVFLSLFRKKKGFGWCVAVVWLSFCMAENYFEYPKVIIMLYICFIFAKCNKDMNKIYTLPNLQLQKARS